MAQSDPIRLPASPQPWGRQHPRPARYRSRFSLKHPKPQTLQPGGAAPRGPWEPPASRFQGPRGSKPFLQKTWPKFPFLGVFALASLARLTPPSRAPPWHPLTPRSEGLGQIPVFVPTLPLARPAPPPPHGLPCPVPVGPVLEPP